ncbi:hypothetical protein [Kalamiella sp. sgz302252]|uniref:hypothetical protein n=1 Tax=Pantoea sp. sgz302252 TaxID=3341827 RepID=UPI0036D36F12
MPNQYNTKPAALEQLYHGRLAGLRQQQVEYILDDIFSKNPKVTEQVITLLPESLPAELAKTIFNGIRRECRILARG